MKKTSNQRLSLKKEYIRVLTRMDLDKARGGFITCSYPSDDCCGSASTATSYACGE